MDWVAIKKRRDNLFSFPVLIISFLFLCLHAVIGYFLATATQINFTEFMEFADSSMRLSEIAG